MAKTYNFKVLGCRVNHAERREMEAILHDRGLLPNANGDADIEVVHTCSVTGQAAAKSRNAIRRASRLGHTVFVTGCFTGTDPKVAAQLGDVVIEQAGDEPMLERFTQKLDAWLNRPIQHQRAQPKTHALPIASLPTKPAHHIRAELRIQDGCDAFCTFCIIPKIRTTLRSKTVKDVVAEATRLVELGHKEIVLTGIFIGAYGHETALRHKQENPDNEYLADLLDAVAQIEGLQRLRISSMEPGDVTESLLDAILANRPVVVPHLHLPLQSGCDSVLAKMNRQYKLGAYLDMIEMVNDRLIVDGLPPAISTDVICGFPTEREHDFDETYAIAKQVGFMHMHIFPYSVRTGTAAARWKQLPPQVVRERVQRLLALDEELSLKYRQQLIGRQVEVIIEQSANKEGHMRGRCEYYAEITVPTTERHGSLIAVKVTEVTNQTTVGLPTLAIL